MISAATWRKIIRNLYLTFLLAVAFPSLGSSQTVVPRQQAGFQVYKISTTSSKIGLEDANFVHVTPATVSSTQRQHRYQIASNGQIGDHSAIDWKQPKDQSYLILPVRNDVSFSTGTTGQLDVTSASGLVFRFRSGLLSAITNGSGGQPCAVTFSRNAGPSAPDFKIDGCDDRIVFDSGIGTTNGAYANLTATTRVSDSRGRSCTVPNSTLYERLSGRNTTADVRLKSQNLIYQTLKRNTACATLDFSPLAPSRLGPDFLKGLSDR